MTDIIRVFRARVKPGADEEFRRFFTVDALALMRSQPGCLEVRIGLPTPDSPRDFLMITKWSDLDSLAGFAGGDWREAVIDHGEAHLLEEVETQHYVEFDVSTAAEEHL
jgi:antibiotic biosynthesis monooxygenase (ABM) superfamily enzyme